MRMLDAMTALTCERGFAGASVTLVCARAKVSRCAFYEEFETREACFLAVLDDGLRLASDVISGASERARAEETDDATAALSGLREALAALLALMDERPQLARLWMVEAQAAGAWALTRRERNVMALTEQIVVRWGPPPDGKAIGPAAVMASVLGLIQRHVLAGAQEPLLTLLGPLMGVVGTPYLDAAAVEREVRNGRALSRRLLDCTSPGLVAPERPRVPPLLSNPRAHRAWGCLHYLAEKPGASNREVANAIGIVAHNQASALLSRLEREGLLDKRSGAPGMANAWSLTARGALLLGIDSRDERTSNFAKTAAELKMPS